jgi:hypothetical protein
MKKKKEVKKPVEVIESIESNEVKPILEKVEVKEEKLPNGARVIVSHNG